MGGIPCKTQGTEPRKARSSPQGRRIEDARVILTTMKNYFVMAGIALVVSLVVGLTVSKPVNTVVQRVTDGKLGSVASPDIMSPYFSFGGVRHWGARSDSLVQATTTVCAIQSPAATSTLIMGSIRLSVGSTTASTVTIAKSATAYATTTLIGGGALGAGAQGTFSATTTPSTGTSLDGPMVFGPSQYLVVGMQGGVGGTFSPTGNCQATWVQNAY